MVPTANEELYTCKSDFFEEGGNDIEATKRMTLRGWLNGRGKKLSLLHNRYRDRRRIRKPLTS